MRPIVALPPLFAPVLALLLAGCSAVPQAQRQHMAPRNATINFSTAPDARQCLADLGARHAVFSPLPDQYFGAHCSTLSAVKLMSVASDDAALSVTNLGPVTCPLAATFAGWARYGVDRAARQILGSPLMRIETMGSYACRTIAGTDRMSAHSTGNAIDVAGFVLENGRRITVLGDWSAGEADSRLFLRTIEASACKRFGVVLGPDYNSSHRNHLHVELAGVTAKGTYCH